MSKRKPKSMMDRRMDIFAEMDVLREFAKSEGYLQGCRAAAPDLLDTERVREREDMARDGAFESQRRLVSMINAAIRAARAKP